MQNHDYFKKLAVRERVLSVNLALADLLVQTLEDFVKEDSAVALQKRFLVTEVGYAYQHFGFCIFGPAGRILLTSHLASTSGVSPDVLGEWLEAVCYLLLEDFNILRLVEGEPDWDSVDEVFFRDFTKRIIASESKDFAELGLDCWDSEMTSTLESVVCRGIDLARRGSQDAMARSLKVELLEIPFGVRFAEAMQACLVEIAQNPLQLLVWRLEFYSSFSDIRQEAKFFVRNDGHGVEARAYCLAALLSLLIPHCGVDASLLLPESPLTLSQMSKVLKSNYKSTAFDTSLLKNWLRIDDSNVAERLEELTRAATEIGLLFEVPVGKNQKGYGLSKPALAILAPFHEAISSTLIKLENKDIPGEEPASLQNEGPAVENSQPSIGTYLN